MVHTLCLSSRNGASNPASPYLALQGSGNQLPQTQKNISRWSRRGATVIAVAALLATGAGIAPAMAADDPVESTADLITRVAPDQGQVLESSPQDGSVAVATGDVVVEIPVDPSEAITVSADGASFSVSLPEEISVEDASVADDGTVVYPSAEGHDVTAAVQVLDDGVARVQTIIENQSGSHEFTYSFGDGYTPVLAADGKTVVIVGDEGQALVAPAWARDANGASVPTRYEIRGSTLVQIVEPDAAAVYPIVADPTWNWYNAAWGAKFNRYETKTMASAGGAAGMCAILATWAPPVAAVCGFYGAYFFTQASIANSQGKCVFISVVPAPLAMVYKDGHCY